MTSPGSRRIAFLQEMGLGPVWRQRAAAAQQADPVAEVGEVAAQAMPAIAPVLREPALREPALSAPGLPEPAPLELTPPEPAPWQHDADADPGDAELPPWVLEETPFDDEPAQADDTAATAGIARMDWDALQAAVAGCTRCRLCDTRTRTVFGTGDRQARWLFVGEGPGHNEDLQGEPFVGPAGKLLDNMMAAMGLRRGENTYIANIVKCRPIGENGRDRPPAPDESATCLPYLERQIALIRPSVIVALGKSAALALLQAGPETSVSSLRGRVHRHAGVPLVVTYHPAYLLRKPEDKGQAWRDLCLAMATHAGAATGN